MWRPPLLFVGYGEQNNIFGPVTLNLFQIDELEKNVAFRPALLP